MKVFILAVFVLHILSVIASLRGRVERKAQTRKLHRNAYWARVSVGTPPQPLTVILDSGSGNVVLPSTSCKSKSCERHHKYDPSHSSTSAATNSHRGDAVTVNFGTGFVKGPLYKDQLCFSKDMCIEQSFIAAHDMAEYPFAKAPFDGIMGLGMPQLSIDHRFNVMSNIKQSHPEVGGMLSMYFADSGSNELGFGGIRRDRIASRVVWTPVVIPGYWEVKMDAIWVGGKRTDLCGTEGCKMVPDSGSAAMGAPTFIASSLKRMIGYTTKQACRQKASFPPIGFEINGHVLYMSPDDYIDTEELSRCDFLLEPWDIPRPKGPMFVLGAPFLRRFATIYDIDQQRVGFAEAKHEGQQKTHFLTEVNTEVNKDKNIRGRLLTKVSPHIQVVTAPVAGGQFEGGYQPEEEKVFGGSSLLQTSLITDEHPPEPTKTLEFFKVEA